MHPPATRATNQEAAHMPWYDNADISRITDAPREGVICFDTETTGLDAGGRDEILQLSVVDGTGAVLFSDYVRPEHRQRWPKAQEVNGITPAMVRDKRTMSELLPELNEIFSRARVLVAYNLEFDLRFLEAAGVRVPTCPHFDVMKEFAPVAGKWDERHGDWRWVKLGQRARHYGYRFDAHDALEDTKATLRCFDAMLSDDAPGGYLSLVEGGRRRQEESARRREEYEAKRRGEEERRERYESSAEGTLERLQREENARTERAFASGDAKRVSKTTYVALATLLGWIGAHEFYAGRTARGVLSVVFCWTLVPWVVAIIQAVKMARAEAEPDGSTVVWKKPNHR